MNLFSNDRDVHSLRLNPHETKTVWSENFIRFMDYH